MCIRALFLSLALCWIVTGFARSTGESDQRPSQHGGQVRPAGSYRLELVAGDNELSLYVTDQADQPVSSTGASGKAIVMTGKKRYVLILSSAGDNKLQGTGEFTLGKSSPVTVIFKLPEIDSQLVHFKLSKKPKSHSHKS